MLWSAQRKTGKTTAVGNLARCLLTGQPFLWKFDTVPLTGRVVVLNYEVTGAQFARWMHDIDVPADRLYVVNLPGRRNLLADAAAGRHSPSSSARRRVRCWSSTRSGAPTRGSPRTTPQRSPRGSGASTRSPRSPVCLRSS